MTWSKRHPELHAALLEFGSRMATFADPVVSWCSARQESVEWLLLASALRQGIAARAEVLVLESLRSRIGSDFWRLPAPTRQEIHNSVECWQGNRGWTVRPYVPGILWSVGEFIRNHDPLRDWLCASPSKQASEELSRVFFMGRSNPQRPKVRWFLWRCSAQSPVGLGLPLQGRSSPPALSLGALRFSRQQGLRDFRASGGADDADHYLGRFCMALSPSDPGILVHALAFYQERHLQELECAALLGGCSQCPLSRFCPAYEAHRD